jgi:penicillin amidase
MYKGAWEPLRIIREEIRVKGEAPRTVELKFSRHGPIFYEDKSNHRAYAVKSVSQEPGTAPYLGSFKLAQALSCADFFDRAMYWKMPTHNLICGDVEGNIALQVTGLTPDRDGWNGRLPVPGTGKYEWRGFRSDLPREFNPARGYIATANNNTHPAGYAGRPVFYHSTQGVDIARITRIHQLLGEGGKFSIQDHERFQHDAYSLRAERDRPLFRGWTAKDSDVERARDLIDRWNRVLTGNSTVGAIYVRWTTTDAARDLDSAARGADRRGLVEQGLKQAIERLTRDWGPDWAEWRYGRINQSELPHMFVPFFDLPTVERPGGFNTVNATGANFRRIIDLSNLDNSVATNAPGQSAQPGSSYYGNLREYLGNEEYFPLLFTRDAITQHTAHRLTLRPE